MKKILHMALALSLALALAACGGKEEKYTTGDVQAMVDAGAFSEELEELDGDTAFLLYKLADYGLDEGDVKKCAVLRSAGATCEEAAVLVLSGNQQAKRAAEGLGTYLNDQIKANENYRPAEIPKLKEAYLSIKDNTVLMVVANDPEAAKAAVEGEPSFTGPEGTDTAS